MRTVILYILHKLYQKKKKLWINIKQWKPRQQLLFKLELGIVIIINKRKNV